MAKTKQKPTAEGVMDQLLDELGSVFSEQHQQLQEIAADLARKREEFRKAREELSRTGVAESTAQAEIEGLPQRLQWAEIRADEGEKKTVQQRYAELSQNLQSAEEDRQRAEAVFDYADPAQAESVAYQRASAQADAMLEAARKQREQLVERIEEAERELAEEARRVHQFGSTHRRVTGGHA